MAKHKHKYCACSKTGFIRIRGITLCLECFRLIETTQGTFTQKSYNAYLSSKQWRARRAYKLRLSNYTCEKCGHQSRKYLEVHHLTYKNFGREPASDLQVLCKPCHEREHEGKNKTGQPPLDLPAVRLAGDAQRRSLGGLVDRGRAATRTVC